MNKSFFNDWKIYWQKSRKYLLLCLLMVLACNLYFIFLLRDSHFIYLLYLDFLLLFCLFLFVAADCHTLHKAQEKKRRFLQYETPVCSEPELAQLENLEIAVHDVNILQNQLQEQFQENCALQDYITRWCHEVKIPLSASLLINEKNKDSQLRHSMKEQLERINQQLNSVLLGCKLQSSLLDIQIRPVNLQEAVRTSIRNNQFFLIRNHFNLDLQVEPLIVYSDKEWIVYVLDQLLGNAVKYAGAISEDQFPDESYADSCPEEPVLKIWSSRQEDSITLFVEDHGEGIKSCDIRRIFEKGFTGSSRHNGRYKSTGMGLYMVSIIIKKLGHSIHAESEYGKFTRFSITFQDNREFFHL